MTKQIRIEIIARDKFWRKAFSVEWEHQFPERKLRLDADAKYLLAPAEWLPDLRRVGAICFTQIVQSPTNPSRRLLLQRLTGFDRDKEG